MIITKYINKEDYIELTIHLEEAIKPYQRNRSGRGHTYDPLNTYKNNLKNKLKELLESKLDNLQLEGECEFNIEYFIAYPKSSLNKKREKAINANSKVSLDNLFNQIEKANLKVLNLIVKADVQGSVEAVKQSLEKISNEEVTVKVIHSAAGAVTESDVTLAKLNEIFNHKHKLLLNQNNNLNNWKTKKIQ